MLLDIDLHRLYTGTLLSLCLLSSGNILHFKFTLHSPCPLFEVDIDGTVSIHATHFNLDLILIPL